MFDVFRSLPGALEALENEPEVRRALVFAAWHRAAGEGLGPHTAAVRFEDSVLTVAVAGVAWRRQLEDFAAQLLFRLNALVGSPAVRRIDFLVDAAAFEKAETQASDSDGSLRQAALESVPVEVLMAAEAIEDRGLKRNFLLAAGSCISRRPGSS